MRIVNLVLNNFVNDSRVLKSSKTIANLGHELEVVAMHETGLLSHESIHNFKVHRIKLISRNWPKLKFVQIIKLFEFISRFIFLYRKIEVIHCNDLDALFVGCLCKITRPRIKIVYDSHEYAINDIPNQSWVSIKLKFLMEGFLIQFSHKVITVSDSIANEYARLYKIPKPYLVLNCPNYVEQSKNNLFRSSLKIREDQRIFLYQGGLGYGRGIELLIDVFSQMENDINVLIFMGSGPLEDVIRKKSIESKTIYFHREVSANVLLDFTSSADYGILFYEDSCLNHRYCSPNKIFEYIMAGLPILTSNLYEMKRLVEAEKIGIVAQDNTVNGLKMAVISSLNQNYAEIQANVHKAREHYCWEKQESALKEIYL